MAVLFIDLCNVLERISKTTKRLEIQEILSEFLKKIIADDSDCLYAVLYLCNSTVFPEYHNTELGVGEHIIQSTVSEATGLSIKTLKQKFVKTGDLGVIAMENRVNQLFIAKRQLTVMSVFEQLRQIARENGKNSTSSKKNLMLSLMNASSPLETKYIVRLFGCKLKIGLALQTILISLSLAFDESNFQLIKSAYNKHPDFEHLCGLLVKHGPARLEELCKTQLGIPVKPMLAQPSKNLTKAFSKVENSKFLSEFKYDGERVQIHHFEGKTKIFSRNLEEHTGKYPDIVSLDLGTKSFIIDAEAVAFEDGKILPFQTLSTRKRKNVEKIEVQVCVFAFDILLFDGNELLDLPLEKRRQLLISNFTDIENRFYIANGVECGSLDDIETHFRLAIQSECEGVMVKTLQSVYMPSHRSNYWIKIKKDYLDALGDSLDLVVIGAFYGKGKRTGNFGGFLLAVYNDEKDVFEACCKIGTGFSDEDLRIFYEQLGSLATTDTSRIVYKERTVKPDVWITPRHIWEIKAASLSLSPVYSAGTWEDKGISLRFPRFIRERTDKSAEDATTSNQIVRMYNESVDAGEEVEDEFN